MDVGESDKTIDSDTQLNLPILTNLTFQQLTILVVYSQPYQDSVLSLKQLEILNRATSCLNQKLLYPYNWLNCYTKMDFEYFKLN